MALVPGVKAPVWDFTIDRSAEAATVAGSVDVVPGLGSVVAPGCGVTLAVLTMVGPVYVGASVTVRVMGALVIPAAVTRAAVDVQVTTGPACVHDHPAPVAEANDSPVGNVSVTTNPPALSDGPVSWTVSWYCTLVPAVNAPVWDLSTVRWAEGVTVVTVLPASLFVGVGSAVGDWTAAALCRVLVRYPGSTWTVRVTTEVAEGPDAAIGADRWQVMVWPACVQVQPAPAPET